jgi:serine/threonine protein kinase
MVKDKLTETNFAVKAFSKGSLLTNSTGKPALINEINIMRIVDSEYSVKLEAVYETKNSVYLVLELLEGGEIFKIDNGKLVKSHAKYILYHLLKGLRDLRKVNIIHRDLKPDNIIFKFSDCNLLENKIKLVDFGLSAICAKETHLIHRKCGTPGFIAPEVINMPKTATADVCHNCDIFSVGMIFFFMLTGIIPYDGEDIYEIMKNNKKADIDFNIRELKKFGSSCIDLLKKMLALKGENRITPVEALEHSYFDDYTKYKTMISMNLDEEVCENVDLIVAEEMANTESINLADNFQKIKNRYQPTPSFRLKNSINFNPNPELYNGIETYSEVNSNYSQSPEHTSDKGSRVSGKGGKDFIIRMTPLQRGRKLNQTKGKKQEFYRNVLMKNIYGKAEDSNSASNKSDGSREKKMSNCSYDMAKSGFSNDIGLSRGNSSGFNSPAHMSP